AMWKSVLNVDTEIVLKNWDEYESSFRAGDYDVARRSYVMQTADEESSLREMLEPETIALSVPVQTGERATTAQTPEKNGKPDTAEVKQEGNAPASATPQVPLPSITEAQAMKELP